MILCKQKTGKVKMLIYCMCRCRREVFVVTVIELLQKIANRDQTLKLNNLEVIVAQRSFAPNLNRRIPTRNKRTLIPNLQLYLTRR
jgi:hypothetical protein